MKSWRIFSEVNLDCRLRILDIDKWGVNVENIIVILFLWPWMSDGNYPVQDKTWCGFQTMKPQGMMCRIISRLSVSMNTERNAVAWAVLIRYFTKIGIEICDIFDSEELPINERKFLPEHSFARAASLYIMWERTSLVGCIATRKQTLSHPLIVKELLRKVCGWV